MNVADDPEVAAAKAELFARMASLAPLPRFVPSSEGVILERGSDIVLRAIQWLWHGWLPRGKLCLLAGQPGTGKTTLALTMAATVTIGGRFPDGRSCKPGNILIWSGEDDIRDTLMPRLVASGADPQRCYFVGGFNEGVERVTFDPSEHLSDLLLKVQAIGGIDLLIVDPVVSAVAGDSHKNTEVRRDLQPLVDLAAATNAAVVGISHFSKGGQGQDPTQRVIGSVAFAAVARIVMVSAKVKGEEGKDARILARSKSNIGPDGGGFEYFLEQVNVKDANGDDVEASRVMWGSAMTGSARELLTDPADETEDTGSDAGDMLRAELTGPGWFPAKVVTKAMTEAGFTKKQIWAAGNKLNVSRRKGAMKEGWYWRMPGGGDLEDSHEDIEGSVFKRGESSESSESSKVPFQPEGSEDSTSSKTEPWGAAMDSSASEVRHEASPRQER